MQKNIPNEAGCDVASTISNGHVPHPTMHYTIIVADEHLNEHQYNLDDPVPTGRQILQAAGVRNVEDYVLYAILPLGDFEDLRLDETYDLRTLGMERFIIFPTDRTFRLTIDQRQIQWGKPEINSNVLKRLAGVDPEVYAVWQDVQCGEDKQIEDNMFIDLSAPKAEKFYTKVKHITIIVNGRPKQINKTELSFIEIIRLAFPNAIINETTAYTVTFKRGHPSKPEGSLVDGESVCLKDGEVFNVTATDKS